MPDRIRVQVDGRELQLSNLDKVMYPAARYTKGEVIDYYTRVSVALLPHLAGRPVTRIRYPNGVSAKGFFEKDAPAGRPSWVRTARLPVPGSTKDREHVDFVLVADLPTLVWLAHLAALELHVPQWRVGPRGGVRSPDLLVFDLDPGPPAGLPECMRVALLLRDELAADGLTGYPKTSGRKGMQLLCPVSGRQSDSVVAGYARALAERLADRAPDRVVARMRRQLRPGKVFIDWSQNNAAKTTVAPYSLRAQPEPTASMPLTWDEVASGRIVPATPDRVLERLDQHGDLLEPVLKRGPKVPT